MIQDDLSKQTSSSHMGYNQAIRGLLFLVEMASPGTFVALRPAERPCVKMFRPVLSEAKSIASKSFELKDDRSSLRACGGNVTSLKME